MSSLFNIECMSKASVLLVVLVRDDDVVFVGVRGGVTPGECVDILSDVMAFIFVIAKDRRRGLMTFYRMNLLHSSAWIL